MNEYAPRAWRRGPHLDADTAARRCRDSFNSRAFFSLVPEVQNQRAAHVSEVGGRNAPAGTVSKFVS